MTDEAAPVLRVAVARRDYGTPQSVIFPLFDERPVRHDLDLRRVVVRFEFARLGVLPQLNEINILQIVLRSDTDVDPDTAGPKGPHQNVLIVVVNWAGPHVVHAVSVIEPLGS